MQIQLDHADPCSGATEFEKQKQKLLYRQQNSALKLFLLDWGQGRGSPELVADGVVLDGKERRHFQLTAFLFSLSWKTVLNIETLNKHLEETDSGWMIKGRALKIVFFFKKKNVLLLNCVCTYVCLCCVQNCVCGVCVSVSMLCMSMCLYVQCVLCVSMCLCMCSVCCMCLWGGYSTEEGLLVHIARRRQEFSSQHPPQAVHNCLQLQLQGIQTPVLDASGAHTHMYSPTQRHLKKKSVSWVKQSRDFPETGKKNTHTHKLVFNSFQLIG